MRIVALFFLCFSFAAAFSPLPHQHLSVALNIAAEHDRAEFIRNSFSCFLGGLAVSCCSAQAIAATNPFENSFLVAEKVKQLDMSLPSYSDISSSKASVDSVDNVISLSVDESKAASGIPQGFKKVLAKSSVLPSMGKDTGNKKKKRKMGAYNF